MKPGLPLGHPHTIRYTVPTHQTVPHLLPTLPEFRRGQPVFATGFLVGLAEAPCMATVHPYLDDGEATVGTVITLHHTTATPPGTTLLATARATGITGRSVHFDITVTTLDGTTAATAHHTLHIIDTARFHHRLATGRPATAPRPALTLGALPQAGAA